MTEERTLLRGRIPQFLIDSIDAWIDHGVLPHIFIRAIVSNDLFRAMKIAIDNPKLLMAALPDIVVYFANHAPAACWGSPEVLSTWTGQASH